MAEAVVSFVVENISDLLNEKAQILNGEVRGQVEEVVAKFRWMQSFLRDADARQKEERVGKWIADLRQLVYDAEDELESFVLKASSLKKGGTKSIIKRCVCVLDNECMYRHKFGREMEAIQRRMAELTTRLHEYNIRSIAPVASSSSTCRSNETPGKLKRFYSHVVVEPQVVGLQEDVESLVAHLVNESDDECYRVVSIYGMGGIGKSTLAQKIYNHPTINTHFSGNLAWVSISQKWELKNVLQRIIFCLVQDPKQRKEIMKFEDDKIMEYLHQLQQSRKCLVVLDDIWSNDAWDGLKAAFPIQHLKSKLMLTSRNVQVCKHVDPKGFLHQPRLLNEQQSWDWELLQMKALPKQNSFDTRSYVKEMEELGRKMVGHCKGLPLAIVVLGGILVTKPTLTEWEKVHQEIQSSIRSGKRMGEELQREVLDILVLSYNDLPYQLKPCFLYLSKFGEDAEINAEKLYQLWIAEGLVLSSDRRDDETMMEVAESYLAELVHRCMVQVKFEDEELSLRKFRSCRLHDLMTDLSLSKAVEEDFFKVFHLRRGSDYHHDEQSVEYFAYTRRLVIFYLEGGESRDMRSTISSRKDASRSLRSVLLFNVGGWRMERWPPIFRILNQIGNFRLLRVLSFEGFSYVEEALTLKGVVPGIHYLIKLQKVLGTLVHLRYLSLKDTLMLKFPTFIENLEQLQTLDLRFTRGFLYISCSAKHIVLKMEHLRHLYLPNYDDIVDDQEKLKFGFDGLSKLETLENFNTRWCEVKDLQKLNGLRKLTVTTTNNRVELEEIMQYFSKASSSLRYTSLTIRLLDEYNLGWGNGSSPLKQLLWSDRCKLNLLRTQGPIGDLLVFDNSSHTATSTLTSVMFESSGLEEDPMPVLEKIPTLRKLLFWDDAVLAREMVCSAMGFPQLIRLVLHHMPNLEKWRVDRGSMPNLSKLFIWKCVKLEELPEGLKFINALQHLEILGMPKKFCDRIRLVDGEQGPDFYKVAHVPFIKFSDD